MRFDFVLVLAAALGAGTAAGVFLAFSAGVMRALGRLPAPQGIAAMQSINRAVINPVFLGAFLGAAALCVAVVVRSLAGSDEPGAGLRLAGALVYLVGSFGATMAFNVPRNEALAVVDPSTADAARIWTGYLATWTAWNHVRLVASLAAAVLLTLDLPPRLP
jgi:uncharacterized membrane protein